MCQVKEDLRGSPRFSSAKSNLLKNQIRHQIRHFLKDCGKAVPCGLDMRGTTMKHRDCRDPRRPWPLSWQ
ncbi:hypothetical protein LEMLEM_LOCUS1829 [Lemmus lemmus]